MKTHPGENPDKLYLKIFAEKGNLQKTTDHEGRSCKDRREQTDYLNVPLKADGSEDRKLQVFETQKSSFADSDPFLVKPFGCILCNEMFHVEMDFKEHCFQPCYFPVDDEYAELF